jgi:hypothetical protein
LSTRPGQVHSAWTIRAYTDDISRFATAKKYAAYAGLVPWVQNSNETVHIGKITKRGPEELRTTVGWRLMEWYEAMKRHKGSGKSIVATARKLATILWHMLSEDAAFDASLMVEGKPAKKAGVMQEAGVATAVCALAATAEAEEKPLPRKAGTKRNTATDNKKVG